VTGKAGEGDYISRSNILADPFLLSVFRLPVITDNQKRGT